ncbi:MAG TPA: sulfatase-like hydrolase/transferase [Polyangiales bacterium]|nr:sulfatase-like hydrolase/transferase [Polyangiales bacterium]
MTERAKLRLNLPILRRRRELRGELHDADWSIGAGFALALSLLTWLGRLAMLTLAVTSGLVRDFGPRHWSWLASELAHDLWVALALGLTIGGLLRVSPGRMRWLGIGLGYLALLTGSLIVIVSVPLYAALQTTLQLTQLLLAGGFSDLFDAGLATLPWPLYALLALLLIAACYAVPFLARFAQRHLRALSRFSVGLTVGLLPVALALLGRLAPEDAAQTLQMSAVYEFVASATRYYIRTQARTVDMHGAPHFPKDLMFGQAPPVEPLESLVQTAKLPLSRPNVILVVLESASTLHTGLWNGRPQDTPRMSEISQHGLMFDDYYTAAPVSMKSLFSISCATYPQALPEAETYTNPAIDCQSISELLKAQNYRTALFHGGHFTYTRKDAFFKHRKYDVMRDGAALQNRKKYKRVMWGADDRAVMDDTLAWLDQTHSNPNPFFLHLIFLAPHEPYEVKDAPTPFPTKKPVDRYRNATALIDSQVGRLWDYLKEHNQTDNTLLVLVGDHGESFGEHRGDFMHGGRIYESAVRTPLMLVNPQLFHGTRTPRIGNHTDLVPTILDVIGLEKPARHQGASLLRGYQPHMLYFYGDWQRHYLGLRDGQWKYIYTVDRDRNELYDLTKDAGEANNLALLHPQQVRAYADRLLTWEQFQRELIPNYERLVNGAAACAEKEMCWLDELKPSFQHGTLRANKSAGGMPLQLGKKQYERGLGVTPLSILRYNIRGYGFTRFRGGVGHHPLGKNANLSLKVSTEIYLDDRLLWSSGKLAADEPAKLFDLDISEGSVLELIGYDVDAETWRDFIDWVDLRLTR